MESMQMLSQTIVLLTSLAQVVTPQAGIVTESATEPLQEAGWIVSVDDTLLVDGPTVATAAMGLSTGFAETDGYEREAMFGTAWLDVDGNGCDTRNDILQRDFAEVTLDGDCTVTEGVFHDPFTATTIDFVRGVGTSNEVQVDHIIPLKAAWNGGADQWSQDTRVEFANDPVNLWASEGRQNSSKGDRLADEFMPESEAFHCQYAAQQVWVLTEYSLAISPATQAALTEVLEGCVLPETATTAPTEEPKPEPTETGADETPAEVTPEDAGTEDLTASTSQNLPTWMIVAAVLIAMTLAATSLQAARARSKQRP